jgi:hypothetical protein
VSISHDAQRLAERVDYPEFIGRSGFGYNPNMPGSKEAAEERYLRHKRRVTEQLRAAGLYPGGDVNAYLRTGGEPTDQGTDREGGDDGRTSGPTNGR